MYSAVGDAVDTVGKLVANQTRSTFVNRDFGVGRHRVSARARLLQLRQDVLVVLAVDVDLVAIILLRGRQLPPGASSKHLTNRDAGVSLFVPLVSHFLLVDVIDVLRHVSIVFSRSRSQFWNCLSPRGCANLRRTRHRLTCRPGHTTSNTLKRKFLPAVGCALFLPAMGPLFSPAVGPVRSCQFCFERASRRSGPRSSLLQRQQSSFPQLQSSGFLSRRSSNHSSWSCSLSLLTFREHSSVLLQAA